VKLRLEAVVAKSEVAVDVVMAADAKDAVDK
jgi:hypothetical protein